MPSAKDLAAIDHILDAAGKISKYTNGMVLEVFVSNDLVYDAVTRNLEIVSEATRRLSGEVKAACPDVPWQDWAGLGNIYRHQYERVDPAAVWDVVTRDIPPLAAALRKLPGA